ncbi:ABC transporter permease subunit/CPBP intramembrane protease [Alienimonas californiensis]|uniref:ABC-2 family transporter protein n=1 Tax=Alienimonas californiensis TaxID=2527989 RepID=A0A517PDL4_9PLAN|nr:ABC transporter permease subunit/CPBP intramembrane protease [Alienimonas californiensis]QDT17485.1 ABC-2 family transporter protein [Alienimonas californiensis]
MTWRNTKLLFLREVRDQLRDRRTLFMVAVLPVLLYPALGLGMVQMTVLFREAPQTVVVLGAEHLPGPALIEGERFAAEWFDEPAAADKLRVLTANGPSGGTTEGAARLDAAEEVRAAHERATQAAAELDAALAAGDERGAIVLRERLRVAEARRAELFSQSGIQTLMLVPDTLADQIAALSRRLRDRDAPPAEATGPLPRPIVLHEDADERSRLAYTRVAGALRNWERAVLRDRLTEAGLPADLPAPVAPRGLSLSQPAERAAGVWSKLFPALVVLMTISGAFYPAVDMAAGEKERGTMETLLICPASRGEIVCGKFLAVLTFSLCTAGLNLCSAGLTGGYVASLAGPGMAAGLDGLAPPAPAALAWVALLMVPLAAFYSALCLALATFAKSNKEGQYYLYPILMVSVGLTVFCLSPLVELTPLYAVLPVVNVSLLLKSLLAPGGAAAALPYVPVVLLSSVGYAGMALWWAVELFKREDVLFREAERFNVKDWIAHLLREKEPTPTFGEAAFAFVTVLLLQFAMMGPMQRALAGAPPGAEGETAFRLVVIQQLVTVAFPVLAMGLLLTSSVRRTFRFRRPDWTLMTAAAGLALCLQPVIGVLTHWLTGRFFPEPPAGYAEFSVTMGTVPLPLALLAAAIAPAVCEELAFRGFLLSGFSRSRRPWLAIGLSAVAFGVVHLVPQQVFAATLAGLVLGTIAWKGRSLWPCILFHLIFNGQQVLMGRAEAGEFGTVGEGVHRLLFNEAGYRPIALALCGAGAVGLLVWLARLRRADEAGVDRPSTADAAPHAGALPSTATLGA